MSTDTRRALVANPKLVFSASSQRSDLLDPALTNTWLVAFLVDLCKESPHPILITALNSDHSAGTWHRPPGRAVDCWHANWATVGDDKVVELMKAAAIVGAKRQPALIEVGLSGTAARYKTWVTWPLSNVFLENAPEHLHFAVGAPS